MFRFIILSAILIAVAHANIATKCIGGGDFPISFEIEGCTAAACVLQPQQELVFKAQFKAPEDSKTLRAKLSGFVLEVARFPYHLGAASDACTGLSSPCPISKDQVLNYTLRLPVKTYFLAGSHFPIEIRVLGDSGAPAFCARVPIQVAREE